MKDGSGTTAGFQISIVGSANNSQLKFALKGIEVDFSSNMKAAISIDGTNAEFNKDNKAEDGTSTLSCETVNTKNGYALTRD